MDLPLPSPVAYRQLVVASEADIDELAHVSNQVYLRWILDAGTAHSTALGYDMAAYRAMSAIFIVRRHEIDYLAQIRHGETVAVDTWVETWKQASCLRRTNVTRVADGQLAARAATTWAFCRLPDGRPQRIPAEIITASSVPVRSRGAG